MKDSAVIFKNNEVLSCFSRDSKVSRVRWRPKIERGDWRLERHRKRKEKDKKSKIEKKQNTPKGDPMHMEVKYAFSFHFLLVTVFKMLLWRKVQYSINENLQKISGFTKISLFKYQYFIHERYFVFLATLQWQETALNAPNESTRIWPESIFQGMPMDFHVAAALVGQIQSSQTAMSTVRVNAASSLASNGSSVGVHLAEGGGESSSHVRRTSRSASLQLVTQRSD